MKRPNTWKQVEKLLIWQAATVPLYVKVLVPLIVRIN